MPRTASSARLRSPERRASSRSRSACACWGAQLATQLIQLVFQLLFFQFPRKFPVIRRRKLPAQLTFPLGGFRQKRFQKQIVLEKRKQGCGRS